MAKPITQKRLYNIALFYLSKYDSCSGKVTQMLKRRVQKARQEGLEIPAESDEWIQKTVTDLTNLGYINDRRYAENQIRILSRQGKSATFIRGKLSLAGIPAPLLSELFEAEETDDLARAKRLVQRKKLGPFRPEAVRADFRQKDLATLGRAGFSYEIATTALTIEDEYND